MGSDTTPALPTPDDYRAALALIDARHVSDDALSVAVYAVARAAVDYSAVYAALCATTPHSAESTAAVVAFETTCRTRTAAVAALCALAKGGAS